MNKKVLLLIRDGWGYRESCDENAICRTPTPRTDEIMKTYPNTLVDACGGAVGLPDGYQGNSEVGHMTIGAGRIIFQSLVRINKAIKEGTFFEIPAFTGAVENCKRNGTALHLIGLLQTEGVHAHRDHLFALLDLCAKMDFKDVNVHLITDGRDAPVTASLGHVAALKAKLTELGLGRIASVSGRFFAMDRDTRWDRTKTAYDTVVGAANACFDDAEEYIKASHAADKTDEFIQPACLNGYEGVKTKDSFIFTNFRTDRTRQLTKAIVEKEFDGWDREPLDVYYVGMTQFYRPMNAHVAFADQSLDNLLGKVVADGGKKQLRISETEKYAHVTFFFNGQAEEPNDGEDRILINSPKVATYDLQPEMSVYEIAEKLTAALAEEKYDLVVTNLVNGDMVGHTGIEEAIHKAVAAVDECVGKITDAALAHGYETLIFADHGNAEDQTNDWRTSHTMNPVPLILVSDAPVLKGAKLKEGKGLQDIAPTTLELLGLPVPGEMTGESVIAK